MRRPTLALLIACSLLAAGSVPAVAGGVAAAPSAAGTGTGPVAATASGSPASPSAALPACRYTDVRTRYTSLADWRKTLLDTIEKVGRSYAPHDLVSTSAAHIGGGGRVRRLVIADLGAMARAAKRVGAGIAVQSAYRSYAQQVATFNFWVHKVGRKAALLASARPGHSEHQLGTTIDFRSANSTRAPWNYPDWARTVAGAWMQANAWKFGFVMSYPKGKLAVACYQYEPWHYRYVGRSEAAAVHRSRAVLRRFLWNHFETA